MARSLHIDADDCKESGRVKGDLYGVIISATVPSYYPSAATGTPAILLKRRIERRF
jgi:hypothetical protein